MKLDPETERLILERAGPSDRPRPAAESGLETAFERLWKMLGNGQEPTREYVFAADVGRRWRFDFAWPERLLAVELEGVFYGGQTRHQRRGGYEADIEKYNEATRRGWRVIRFTQTDLKERPVQTIELVKRVLEGRT